MPELGTPIANLISQNKRVDKGKSGLPSDCGEWKLWGRHPLTIEKAGGGSFGGTGLTLVDSRRAIVARLLIDVLTRLGGAFQEDQQPALFLSAKPEQDVKKE